MKILVPRSNLQATWKVWRAARHVSFQASLRETHSRSIAKRGGPAMKLCLWLQLPLSLSFSAIFATEKGGFGSAGKGRGREAQQGRGAGQRVRKVPSPLPPPLPLRDGAQSPCTSFAGSPHKQDNGLTISRGISPGSSPVLPPDSPGAHGTEELFHLSG